MPGHSIRRRSVLGAAAVATTALAVAPAQAAARKAFVFVHGAYHGGWCWRRVTDILESHGHKTYAPSLTGCGDRSHLLRNDLTLDNYIDDIANLMQWEDLRDACLVAHSYGGFPASGALEKIHDRVSSIVWVDSFTPEDGQRPQDFVSEFSRKALAVAVAKGEPGRAPPPAKAFSLSEKDYAWIESKLTQQPNGPEPNAIRITGKREAVAKKTYIRMPKYPQPSFDKALARCQADPTWKTMTNDSSGHDVMIDQPEWLADVLLKSS